MVETKEFVWLTNDLVFKHVFSHKEITLDFLNSYLEFVNTEVRVTDILITPQRYVQNDHIKLHDYYLDICVVLSNGEIINLEMYNNFGITECKKSLTYASMLYSHQLKKQETYDNAKKVTSLNIMSGNYVGVNDKLINKYELVNENNHKLLLKDGLEILLLRLDISDKIEYSINKSRCIKWLKFMNCKTYEEALNMAKGYKIFMSTVDIVKSFVSDPEVMNLFDRDKLKEESAEIRGREYGILKGKDLGLKEGKDLGLREGQRKEKLETAKNMLKENFSFEQISKITHLSTSEIKKLV